MGHTARRLRRAAVLATGASLALSALSGSTGVALAKGSTWASRSGGASRAVVVQAQPGQAAAAAAAVRAAGGRVDKDLPLVEGFSAFVPAGAVAALRTNAAVRAVTENSQVRFAGLSYDDTVASAFAKASGATQAWAQGNLGEGVGVAVIDTGVSPMNDFGNRVVYGPDLSGEATYIDTYGHGTVMGGLIAGSGADSANNTNGAYTGVAPKATLVSVKAAGRNGAADVSTLLQAMHWVSAYKDQFNIRVLNLSWGTNSTTDPASDPLNYAVQRLWRQGIVVVVSAGNNGSNAGTVTKPGDDPMVLTVGAYDDKGDARPENDSIPAWTSRGPTSTGLTKPDVIAPGRTLIATRSFGSTVERDNPRALISPSYIKGSGTSEAAAVTSGLAALLVKAHPDWTPDQVKAAIKGTASPIPNVTANTQGTGRVQLGAALAATPTTATQSGNANGLGPIEGSRGTAHVQTDCLADGTMDLIQGEIDVYCRPWNGSSWAGSSWAGDAWTGSSWANYVWNGSSWGGSSWGGSSWGGSSWAGGQWTGSSWAGSSWAGSSWGGSSWGGSSWGGSSWGGSSWAGSSWAGSSWGGVAWAGSSWAGEGWTSAEYGDTDLFLSAFWGHRPRADQHVTGEVSEPRQLRGRE